MCDLFFPLFLHELLLKKIPVFIAGTSLFCDAQESQSSCWIKAWREYYNVMYCMYYYISTWGVPIWFSLSAHSCLKLWSRWLFFEARCHMLFLGINNLTFFGARCIFRLWMMLGGMWVSDKTDEVGGKAADWRRSWQLLREIFFLTCRPVTCLSFMYFSFLNPRHEIMWSFFLLIPTFCLF